MVANLITGIRILCALLLINCPIFSIWYYFFYLIGGISDILDGMVARKFGKETKLGAQFDTIADIIFSVVVIVQVMRVISLPLWLIIWIVCIAIIKVVSVISGFFYYKKFVSEHTIMNKICGILLFAAPLCIVQFPLQPVVMLTVLTCGVATFAAVQEYHYIHFGKEMN